MRLFALWLLHCLSSAVAIGQSYTPPLDPLPKESLPGVGYWQNGGQVADLADNPMNEVRFYSDGVVPRTCFMDGGQLGLVREVLSRDTINPDTLYRVDMIPVDAAPVEPIGIEASLEYMNFYLGHTMPNGVEYMHRYRYVVYPDLWPGITMWVYADGHKQRIAFACAPGSDPSVIRFKYVGQEEALLDPDGNAILNVNVGDLMMPAPMIYKVVGNNAVDLPEEAPATMEEVTDVAGQDAVEYEVPVVEADPTKPTVLLFSEEVPEVERGGGASGMCWSTYYGGNRLDYVTESARDWKNNYYVTGWTRSNPTVFPAGAGGPNVYLSGSYYGTLSQFDDEEFLIWTAMLGGGGNSLTYPMAIAVRDWNPSSTIYIGGHISGTAPNLFTYLAPGSPAYFDNTPTANSPNGFICRFTDAGQLQWSTYWGGHTSIYGMAISDRRLLVTGSTYDPLPAPTVPPPIGATSWAPQPTITSTADAYICAFNINDRSHWVCYLGGTSGESGYDVRVQGSNIYVLGQTQSSNFPCFSELGAYNDNSYNGVADAFLARFNSNFTVLWSTYFGGSAADVSAWNGLAISPLNGDVYIVGTVNNPSMQSTGFPLQPHSNGLAYFDGTLDPGRNGFIAHFKGGTDALRWCTYFGAHDSEHYVEAVTVDKSGFVYIAGESASPALPVMSSPNYAYYQSGIQANDGQDNDCFVAMFKPVDDVMDWCTYFGGNAGNLAERIRTLVAKEGALFAGGITSKYSDLASFFPLQNNGIPGSFYDDVFGDPSSPTQDIFLTKFCTPWSDIDDGGEKSIRHLSGEGTFEFRCWSYDAALFVQGVAEGEELRCFATDGRLVWVERSRSSGGSIQTLDVAQLSPGVYTLVLSSGAHGSFLVP
jgi:hypothetical protein